MLRAVLVALFALVVIGSTARAADFTDPGARVFTLAPDGAVSAITVLPSGDIVYALRGERELGRGAPGRLMRFTADGALHEVRADGAHLLTAESSNTVLRVPEPRLGRPSVRTVERVDVLTGQVTKLPELPGSWGEDYGRSYIDAVTVLDDGTVILATFQGFYEITPDGRAMRLPHQTFGGYQHAGLAPLPGRRFAFPKSEGLMVGDLTGARRLLVAGSFPGPLAASSDGGVLATVHDSASPDGTTDDAPPAIVRVGPDGRMTRLLTPSRRPSNALGNGDGLPLFREALPLGGGGFEDGAFALAGDGTLVFADESGHGLRALVPPDSGRPRIALTQNGFATFASGRIGYTAGSAGSVTVSVRRGTALVVEGRGDATGTGEGEVMLASPLAPGRYAVRLRLTTPYGGAETLARVDTRRVLPLREARSALRSAYEFSDGDEGGSYGTELGACRRQAPRVVRCLLLYFEYLYEFDGPQEGRWSQVNQPAARTTARLRNDGIQSRRRELPGSDNLQPSACFRVSADRHQRVGGGRPLVASVRARCTGRVRVAARLRWRIRGRERRAVRLRARRMHPGQVWRVALPLTRRAARAMGAGRGVRGDIVVRAALSSPYGPIPEEHGIPVFAHR